MCKEIELRKAYVDEVVDTIYLGGGTPSLLARSELTEIIQKVHSSFDVSGAAEITLEANPDDLSQRKAEELQKIGVNRLSIGIQSFSNVLLTFLNRAHTSRMATEAFENARVAGFSNINLDLIYAIPGQTIDVLDSDLDLLVSMNPEHVSCYGLTIEERTAFGKWSKSGKFSEVDDETGAAHFEKVIQKLTKAGYEHYEISNFSKPGFNSRHNSSYWLQRKYLGIGPSAHSYDGNTRQCNVSNNHLYIKALDSGESFFETEMLTREDKINEYLLTSLRTSWGCDLGFLRNNFEYDIIDEHNTYLTNLARDGYISIEHDRLKLLHRGKFIVDKILADLVLVNSDSR